MSTSVNRRDITYLGYNYSPETRLGISVGVVYVHYVTDPDGHRQTIAWSPMTSITPSEFRFLVDHDFPDLSDFGIGKSLTTSYLNSSVLIKLRAFMESRGCHTVELAATMIKLSGWNLRDPID